jgi:hypothetical protein
MSDMGTTITGGCLCRAVRYAAAAPPLVARMCFCRDCQYFACGNATVNAAFPAAAVTITGPLKDFASIADSGAQMHRGFCPECGVHITSAAAARPGTVFIRVGTLDDPSLATPSAAIWMDSAPRWACLDPSVERVARQPPPLKQTT